MPSFTVLVNSFAGAHARLNSTVSLSHAHAASPHGGRLGEGRLISRALDNNGAL